MVERWRAWCKILTHTNWKRHYWNLRNAMLDVAKIMHTSRREVVMTSPIKVTALQKIRWKGKESVTFSCEDHEKKYLVHDVFAGIRHVLISHPFLGVWRQIHGPVTQSVRKKKSNKRVGTNLLQYLRLRANSRFPGYHFKNENIINTIFSFPWRRVTIYCACQQLNVLQSVERRQCLHCYFQQRKK